MVIKAVRINRLHQAGRVFSVPWEMPNRIKTLADGSGIKRSCVCQRSGNDARARGKSGKDMPRQCAPTNSLGWQESCILRPREINGLREWVAGEWVIKGYRFRPCFRKGRAQTVQKALVGYLV